MQTFDAAEFAAAVRSAQWQREPFCWRLVGNARYRNLGSVSLVAPWRWSALGVSGETATLDEAKAAVKVALDKWREM